MTKSWFRRAVLGAVVAAAGLTTLGAAPAPADAAYYRVCNAYGCYSGHYYGPRPYWGWGYGYGYGWRGWHRW